VATDPSPHSGTLFVVATPIGNLEDITLRALRVLREVDAIAAEDTRRTVRLLARHGISVPTISFHEHNRRRRLPELLARLQRGDRLALVTDAGTPGISDPGVDLVQACINARIPVEPVPGVSAPITAAIASGFPLTPLTILGFPPQRAHDRRDWFILISNTPHTVTFFEAPHRIQPTLRELADVLGDRPIMVGRELTKVHQEFLRGTAQEVASHPIHPRGEFTVVVGPAIHRAAQQTHISDEQILHEFCQLTDSEALRRRQVIGQIAKRLGKPSREVYAAIERAKKIG
jgi:16S rRNA (cytidine1402-2'-O)-methyltransferase